MKAIPELDQQQPAKVNAAGDDDKAPLYRAGIAQPLLLRSTPPGDR
jgi:hypothetical protein